MAIMKIIFTLAITMAITITLTMQGIRDVEEIKPDPLEHVSVKNVETHADSKNQVFPSKRTSRFLAEVKNHRAADHCHKDNEVCHHQNLNSTCCNNKCMDLSTDRHNCGACKRKCKFTHACCRGECVNLSFDKRHCGHCNNRCEPGQYCVYGMCDYA